MGLQALRPTATLESSESDKQTAKSAHVRDELLSRGVRRIWQATQGMYVCKLVQNWSLFNFRALLLSDVKFTA